MATVPSACNACWRPRDFGLETLTGDFVQMGGTPEGATDCAKQRCSRPPHRGSDRRDAQRLVIARFREALQRADDLQALASRFAALDAEGNGGKKGR